MGFCSLIGFNANIDEIEKSDDALYILKKYSNQTSCIVCDNLNFSALSLYERKSILRKQSYDSLSSELKQVMDEIINNIELKSNDPFSIRENLLEFIKTGDIDILNNLKDQIKYYIEIVTKLVEQEFISMFNDSDLDAYFDEYANLLESQPILDNEELMLINEVVNENIGPEITIVRDENNGRNFRLLLDGKAFLGGDVVEKNQKPLKLSTGERNFISLAFELLLARHSEKDFVVLDDPISSFDSVYKNKIAYCIIKFLEKKKNIILTHNLDLIRLLEFQNSGCFNLYLLSNHAGGQNGFIKINDVEKKLLINLHDLIKFFKNGDPNATLKECILDKRQFLMSMIPFMRGYAHIMCTEDDIYSDLSEIMHGYSDGSVDVAHIYYRLFGVQLLECCEVSVNDILTIDCNAVVTVNPDCVPLLAETLKQSLLYYHLRMMVENTIVRLFPQTLHENEDTMLGQILQRAFKCNHMDTDYERKMEHRIYFTSRKTLLNEFNHFEGNLNIFQPAIDIEDSALQKEVEDIHERLRLLEEQYG